MSVDARDPTRSTSPHAIGVAGATGLAGRDILTFHAASQLYGLDIASVQEILKRRALTELPRAPAFLMGVVSVRGVVLPVLDLAARLGQRSTLPSQSGRILVVKRQQDIVIKSLGKALANLPGIAGATELGGQQTVLVLDVAAIIEEATTLKRVEAA